MRVSKWVALLRRAALQQLRAVVFVGLAVMLIHPSWPVFLGALGLAFVLLHAIEIVGHWPRRMTGVRWAAVMRQPVVHFTTPALAQAMARDGAERPGGQLGWVYIRPSAGRMDAVGLGGRKATYAFSGFPSRDIWLENVGKHATAAIVINASDLGEMRYRTCDGALMILDGYHGPAEIQATEPVAEGTDGILLQIWSA